jgi:hypothetical protein
MQMHGPTNTLRHAGDKEDDEVKKDNAVTPGLLQLTLR